MRRRSRDGMALSATVAHLNPHVARLCGSGGTPVPPRGENAVTGRETASARVEAPAVSSAAPRAVRLTQAERRFLSGLESGGLLESLGLPSGCRWVCQPTRLLPLPGGGTYTPDFLVLVPGGEPVSAEVKGGYRGPGWEQGVERYRRAASEWDGRGLRFVMATWDGAAGWRLQWWR